MTREAAAEANRLYWQTDKSVAEIAETLDLSRRALYEAIEPVAAGATCDICGTALYYSNRSARDASHGTCFSCATASPQQQPQPSAEAEAWTWSPGARTMDNTRRVASSELAARAQRLGGAALLGAVIGAGVTHLLLRRRD
jgi:hypothetical protein